MFIRNPLQLRYPIVDLDEHNLKASIDAFIQLLISSNKYDSIADEEFGFCLEDFRFESFNIDKAKFHGNFPIKDKTENTELRDIHDSLYAKRLVGSSKSADTFARELKNSIERYERRLKDVVVSMDFQKYGRVIHIIVTGKINNPSNAIYYNEFNVDVW
ncbi:MAG: hypothetical protein IKM95_07965 [Bacteroidales bacterium]|jgi:hypothetical protein|nr:hypothetical protein [Bacteroidales bacterium]